MLDRLATWLDRQPRERRRLYSALIAIVLLTAPCYASGMLLLLLGGAPSPAAEGTREPAPAVTAPGAATAPIAPTVSPIPREPAAREEDASPPTATPTIDLSWLTPTIVFITTTPIASPTAGPSTVTTVPTEVATPTIEAATEAPTSPPTESPSTATAPPPTDAPPSTPEPTSDITPAPPA